MIDVNKDVGVDKQKIIDFRNSQSVYDRMCEYVLGIGLNDPRLFERVEQDIGVVINKYNLPSADQIRQQPLYWRDQMLARIKDNGYQVFPKKNRQEYFDRPGNTAGAVMNKTMKAVFMDFGGDSQKSVNDSVFELRHELVHVLQSVQHPEMPFEAGEYEGSILEFDIEKCRGKKDYLRTNLETRWIYNVLSVYRKDNQEPPWDNPEWFLRNVDKIYETG